MLVAAAWFVLCCGCGAADSGQGMNTDGLIDVTDDARDGAGTGEPEVADLPRSVDGGAEEVVQDLRPTDTGGQADADAAADTGPPGDVEPENVLPPEECWDSEPFDYTCDVALPETCPGGMCLNGLCIGPVLDPNRWKDCGNGSCDICETAATCPVDCGEAPELTGAKEYDNETTITVWVHGFANKGPDDLADMVYGADRSCSGILEMIAGYGIVRPCAEDPEGTLAPNHFAKLEYYGTNPAGWLTPEDIEEIEKFPFSGGPDGLQRYGLVLAKYIRHKLDVSGATHVNLACHSMGCLISRYMIENNIENLAAENRFVRWFTSAGVVAGARLARLFDNPSVQAGAQALGLEVSDFILMNPDYVQDTACWWDHKLQEGNNPLFGGTFIHHTCATDPKIKEALNIALLDLNNPGDEPNDGIMYTFDEFFHEQHPDASAKLPDGKPMAATRSYAYFDHMTVPESEPAALLATAALFHKRKVVVTLKEVELKKDHESHGLFDGQNGKPPAEISFETEVRYNPYVMDAFGKNVLVHEDKTVYRSPPMYTQYQGQTMEPAIPVFAGPVFDEMDSLDLVFNLLEMDYYPRFGLGEWVWDKHQALIEVKGAVPLVNDVLEYENDFARIRLEIRVVDMY